MLFPRNLSFRGPRNSFFVKPAGPKLFVPISNYNCLQQVHLKHFSYMANDNKQAKAANWRLLRGLSPFLWPPGEPGLRRRVLIAFVMLFGGKILSIQVPYVFKAAINALDKSSPNQHPDTGNLESLGQNLDLESLNQNLSILDGAGALLIGYVAARIGAGLAGELKNVLFARVSQAAQRSVARSTFAHLHSLDTTFHAKSSAAVLTRKIERGVRGINFLSTALLFNIVPTACEIALVCGVLTWQFGPAYAAVAGGTVITYAAWTLPLTEWRGRFRRAMNSAENEASGLAIDSLANQETVKLFSAEKRECDTYERALISYEVAARKTASSLALLNVGQQSIFSIALGSIMWMAAGNVIAGNGSIGDLVLVNGLLFQLSLPLSFLGSVYRELQHALVDIEALFDLLRTKPKTKESVSPLYIVDKNYPGPSKSSNIESENASGFKTVEIPKNTHDRNLDELIHGEKITNVQASESLNQTDHLSRKNDVKSIQKRIQQTPDIRPDLKITNGEIIFDNVYFNSSASGRLLVRNFSLRIPPGSRVAIVGPSGCGKSTLARLLVRLEIHDAGKILIDGQEISQVNLHSLRRAIGIVSQDAPLLNRTIYENLTYSWDHKFSQISPQSTIAEVSNTSQSNISVDELELNLFNRSALIDSGSESIERPSSPNIYKDDLEPQISEENKKKVMWACRIAQIDHLVLRIGLRGRIGQRGALLSGGERQRLAVARTLLSNAPIIVFDEATSALDMATERALLNALRQELSGRTCIFIAHRLSAVSDVDLIIVMGADGSVAETGTHHELLSRHGPYHALWHAHDII